MSEKNVMYTHWVSGNFKTIKYKIVPLMVYTKHYTLNAQTIIGEKLVEGHSI